MILQIHWALWPINNILASNIHRHFQFNYNNWIRINLASLHATHFEHAKQQQQPTTKLKEKTCASQWNGLLISSSQHLHINIFCGDWSRYHTHLDTFWKWSARRQPASQQNPLLAAQWNRESEREREKEPSIATATKIFMLIFLVSMFCMHSQLCNKWVLMNKWLVCCLLITFCCFVFFFIHSSSVFHRFRGRASWPHFVACLHVTLCGTCGN